MRADIARLKQLVADFEKLAMSSQPYAYGDSLNTLAQIECQVRILRSSIIAKHKEH